MIINCYWKRLYVDDLTELADFRKSERDLEMFDVWPTDQIFSKLIKRTDSVTDIR